MSAIAELYPLCQLTANVSFQLFGEVVGLNLFWIPRKHRSIYVRNVGTCSYGVSGLVAEGIEKPTNAAVLERMGKGSLANVSPVMREWRASRKAEVVAALEMPGDMKKAVETSFGQIWATASKLAQASVQSYRQEADEAIDAGTQERDEALSEIQRLEGRLAELEKALADKDQAINKGNADLESARALHTKAATENAALAARIEDRDSQIQDLKAELKEARDDNKALQKELVEIAHKTKE